MSDAPDESPPLELPPGPIGWKVRIAGSEDAGFGEVSTLPDAAGEVEVRFYTSPVQFFTVRAPVMELRRDPLPTETRCYHRDPETEVCRGGRVLTAVDGPANQSRPYHVRFPNGVVELLPENDFRVRCYRDEADPVEILAAMAHETPHFFEGRATWIRALTTQERLSLGHPALAAAKVELLPHQVEVVRRALALPSLRVLLADDPGLGKAVEAGVILRQRVLEQPGALVGVFAPEALISEWEQLLGTRFDLPDLSVAPHEDLLAAGEDFDLVVIDEAQQVVGPRANPALAEAVRALAVDCPALILCAPCSAQEPELLAPLLDLLEPEAAHTAEGLRARSQEAGDAPLHPRFLRTARAALLAEGDLSEQRTEPELELALEGSYERLEQSWTLLEEWRVQAAAQAAEGGEAERRRLTSLYLALAGALGSDPAGFEGLLKMQELRPAVEGTAGILIQLQALARAERDDPSHDRVQLLSDVLATRLAQAPQAKHVVFCSSAEQVAAIVARLERSLGAGLVLGASGDQGAYEREEVLRAFRGGDEARFLVVDHSLERGRNLQHADGVVMFDVPWDLERLEERLGCLDKVDRATRIPARVLLGCEDDRVALDLAWHLLACDELGVFGAGLSDQRAFARAQTARLRRLAFEQGPAAVLDQGPALREALAASRRELATHDARDGIDPGEAQGSALWEALEQSEVEAEAFGEALTRYLNGNLGIVRRRVAGQPAQVGAYATGTMKVGKGRHRKEQTVDPLLPRDRLLPLMDYLGLSHTADRLSARRDPDLQFLRPGHPFVNRLLELADWDDRGRAFAMWRRLPKAAQATLVFRVALRLTAGEEAEEDEAPYARRAGREVPNYSELFLNVAGQPVPEPVALYCREPYERGRRDENLGADRALPLRELIGQADWAELCRDVAAAACEQAHDAAKDALGLDAPRIGVRVDAMGVYVLSDEPIAPPPEASEG